MLSMLFNTKIKDLTLFYQILLYLIAITVGIVITYLVVRFLKKKDKKYIKRFIMILLVTGFITHFIKPFFSPYTEMDYPLKKITFENICAVSIILFPFVFMSKNKVLKDYMVILGVVSGIVSFLVPVVIPEHTVFSFEYFRFYYVHFVIFLAPYLMGYFKIHRIDIRRAIKIPLVLLGVFTIILVNEVFITLMGWEDVANLFDPSKRNPSIIFGLGVLPEAIPAELASLTKVITFVTPEFLMNVSFLPKGAYFPVIWMIPPAFIYGIVLSVLVNLYFEKEQTLNYFKTVVLNQPEEEYQNVN